MLEAMFVYCQVKMSRCGRGSDVFSPGEAVWTVERDGLWMAPGSEGSGGESFGWCGVTRGLSGEPAS